MSVEGVDGESGEASKKLRSKNGVPRMSLETVEASVKAIWQVARRGEASSVTVARAITGKPDAKASGGAWGRRVASMRAFNVIEKGPAFKLSPIGLAIANSADQNAYSEGLRDAVMSVPAYQRFLERADGGHLPAADLLASDIEFDYELSNADALHAAESFVQSAKYAGLIDSENLVLLRAADSASEVSGVVAETNSDDAHAAAASNDVHAKPTEPSTFESALPEKSNAVESWIARPSADDSTPVSVKVKIDMTEWAADDVVKVLNALGYGGE